MAQKNTLKPDRIRLVFDCPKTLLDTIKERALYHNCFVREYVIEAVLERLEREKRYIKDGK